MKLLLSILLTIISTSFTYAQLNPFCINDFSSSSWFEDLDNQYALQNSLATPFTEKLDSIIVKGLLTDDILRKLVYYMNDKEEVIAFYNWQDEWVPYAFRKYEYNNKGLITEVSVHGWDGEVGNWDQPSGTKGIYSYNSLNKLESLEVSYTILAGLPDIVNDIEIYDYEGDLMTGARYYGVHTDGSLINVYKSKFIYTNDKIVCAKKYLWREEQWLPHDSIIYSYHPNGQLSKRDYYTMYFFQNDPVIFQDSYHYNYKTDGTLKNIHHYERYDPITDALIWLDIIEYNYLPLGGVESILSFNTNSDWDKNSFPYEGREYDFDTDLPYSKIRYPRANLYFEMSRPLKFKISGVSSYSGLDFSYDPPIPASGTYLTYYYSQLDGTGSEDIEAEAGLQVYPNPATEYITILRGDDDDIPGSFEIFDKGGQRVLQKAKVYSGDRVAIRVLAEGIYFYRLSSGDKVYTGSFMKV